MQAGTANAPDDPPGIELEDPALLLADLTVGDQAVDAVLDDLGPLRERDDLSDCRTPGRMPHSGQQRAAPPWFLILRSSERVYFG